MLPLIISREMKIIESCQSKNHTAEENRVAHEPTSLVQVASEKPEGVAICNGEEKKDSVLQTKSKISSKMEILGPSSEVLMLNRGTGWILDVKSKTKKYVLGELVKEGGLLTSSQAISNNHLYVFGCGSSTISNVPKPSYKPNVPNNYAISLVDMSHYVIKGSHYKRCRVLLYNYYDISLYVIGGNIWEEDLSVCERFDLKKQQWYLLPSLAKRKADDLDHSVCDLDGKIYVFGYKDTSYCYEVLDAHEEEAGWLMITMTKEMTLLNVITACISVNSILFLAKNDTLMKGYVIVPGTTTVKDFTSVIKESRYAYLHSSLLNSGYLYVSDINSRDIRALSLINRKSIIIDEDLFIKGEINSTNK